MRTAPVLRMVAGHTPQAPRTPFVLLVLGLLGGGLVTLLLLNSAAAADAFTQRRLQQATRSLSLREQELSREVAALEAPGALAARARRLGLVQAGDPGFLVLEPTGSARVVGSPATATSPPPSPKPTPTPTAARPTATPGVTARPGARPTARPAPGRPTSSTPTPRATPRATSTPALTPAPGGDR